jgi:hypothetical protein
MMKCYHLLGAVGWAKLPGTAMTIGPALRNFAHAMPMRSVPRGQNRATPAVTLASEQAILPTLQVKPERG